MRLHLDYIPQKAAVEINHSQNLLLLGSCFSENIGARLSESGFKALVNPGGILFNPLSIVSSLNSFINPTPINESLLLQRGERFYSYLHHSSISASTKTGLIDAINTLNADTHKALKEADFLCITFGTAYYYHHVQLAVAVANCHKQAASVFEKRRLSVEEIVSTYTNLIARLREINPRLKIIFTVSPVKHLRDGLIENSLSKSTLLLAVDALREKHPDCFYFPSYELVSDDLRDYRFYAEDMAHPNAQAIDYVWEKFSDCYFNEHTRHLVSLFSKLNAALAHRQITHDAAVEARHASYIAGLKAEILALYPGFGF